MISGYDPMAEFCEYRDATSGSMKLQFLDQLKKYHLFNYNIIAYQRVIYAHHTLT
jgi:hypothetical protein